MRREQPRWFRRELEPAAFFLSISGRPIVSSQACTVSCTFMMRLRCGELSRINADQIVHLFLNLIASSIERLAIRIVAGQKKTAMCAFERIEVVFDQARKTNDFDRVITQICLLIVADCNKQKNPGEEDDYSYTNRSSREQFETKMAGTKKPASALSQKRCFGSGDGSGAGRRFLRLVHYNFRKQVLCQCSGQYRPRR